MFQTSEPVFLNDARVARDFSAESLVSRKSGVLEGHTADPKRNTTEDHDFW